MPLSLKLPEGFIPSYCKYSRPGATPTYLATPSEAWSSVCPSPTVTHCRKGANGSRSWNRHTPLKQCGSLRRAHFCSNSASEPGTRSRSHSYATSNRLPQRSQATRISSMAYVARQAGEIHCWYAAVGGGNGVPPITEVDDVAHTHQSRQIESVDQGPVAGAIAVGGQCWHRRAGGGLTTASGAVYNQKSMGTENCLR